MADIDVVDIILFIVTILLVMLIIYVATRIVTREEVLSSSYVARLFATALIIVIFVPFLSSLLGSLFAMGTAGEILGIIISFLIVVAVTKYLIVAEVSLGNEWLEALGITLLCIIFVYLFNTGISQLGFDPLFILF